MGYNLGYGPRASVCPGAAAPEGTWVAEGSAPSPTLCTRRGCQRARWGHPSSGRTWSSGTSAATPQFATGEISAGEKVPSGLGFGKAQCPHRPRHGFVGLPGHTPSRSLSLKAGQALRADGRLVCGVINLLKIGGEFFVHLSFKYCSHSVHILFKSPFRCSRYRSNVSQLTQ